MMFLNNFYIKRLYYFPMAAIMLIHNLVSSPVLHEIHPSMMMSRRDRKKREDHSRLVGKRLNKQGNLHTRLVLGGHKMSRFTQPLTGFLKVYIEALTKFSHLFSPSGLNATSLS